MGGNLTKARAGVVAKAAVIFAEVAERKAIQMPTMCWIAKRAEIRVMRRNDNDAAAGRY